MKPEISRRKFLQGSVALTILGGVGTTNLFSNSNQNLSKMKFAKIPTLCEMCVNKCAAIAKVENGIVTKLDPNPLLYMIQTD